MFSLKSKLAVITGGGSGIGRAIALLFARQGATVAILERDPKAAEITVRDIERDDGKAFFYLCDVSDRSQVRSTFDEIIKKFGVLDILVNNAGIAHVGNILSTGEEDFDEIYRVNVKGVYFCLKSGIAEMAQRGSGVILNVASIASLIGIKDRFAYSMSKGAVLTMTRSVAMDFVDKGIRCNCICPARIHTPFVDGFVKKNYPGREKEVLADLASYQPIGRMGTPGEVASLALYLCCDEAAFVTGAAYTIDGGVTSLI